VSHPGGGLPVALDLVVVALLAAGWAYLAAAPPDWPRARTACWLLGVGTAVGGLVGVLAGVPDLPGHVAGHLLVGMIAPLLLVAGAPVTLALRTLPRRRARALGRLLRSRRVAVVAHPAVAAALDTGGLWVLYRTPLLAAVPPALVHLHMLLTGYLATFALVGRDPAPHRAALGIRCGVLVAAVAAHDVLAKLVYATPLPGVPVAQAQVAGMLMYYGAAPVHVVLFVLLGREWARRQQRADAPRAGGPGSGIATRARGTSPP
jgi:putative membrane protein